MAHTAAEELARGEELVRKIVEALVEDRDAISIAVVDSEYVRTFQVSVARSETGKLIGKQGRMARALRTILAGAGMKMKRRYIVEIVGEGG